MTALVDTSFLFALTNRNDHNHRQVLHTARTISDPLIVPVPVLPEVCYLIGSRLGHKAMRLFLHNLVANQTQLERLTADDLIRVVELLEEYADSQLDFVDAAIITIAERRKITRILTLDRRDFSIFRPKHCPYFELFP